MIYKFKLVIFPKNPPNDPNRLRVIACKVKEIEGISEKNIIFEDGELVLMVVATGARGIIEKIKNIEEVREVRVKSEIPISTWEGGYYRKRRRGSEWFPE